MSLPEYSDQHSITVLNPHVLLQIFGYLDYEELLQCRLVCPHWYQIIKHNAPLMDHFRFNLTLNAGTIVSTEEPPFSLMHKSKVKLKSIRLQQNFLDPGNNIAVLEANRSRISNLLTILTDINAIDTITEVIVRARDNEPHTSAMLLQMIMKMKNVKILQFTLTAFVHCLETICSTPEFTEPCISIDHVQILHHNGKPFIKADFQRMLRVFPNIKRIDVMVCSTLKINGNDILETFPSLIKSIQIVNLDLGVYQNMSLNHISYNCFAHCAVKVSFLHAFLTEHREIETMCLKLITGSIFSSGYLFPHPFDQLTNLILRIRKFPSSKQMENDLKLGNILKSIPNLKKLDVKYEAELSHQFGHEVIEMKNLIDVAVTCGSFDCDICFKTMLKSIARVKSLQLLAPRNHISLKQIDSIATALEQLEGLVLDNNNNAVRNYFAEWPAMPKLKVLIVHRVGYVTDYGILKLQKNCPMLEVIKFYSLRGAYVNSLLKFTFECFPNIKAITFRGGRSHSISQLDYIKGKVGWRLKELDVSSYIEPPAINKLFKNNDLLETIRCKYGTVVVTRRIYYEAEILNAYTFKSIEQPLKNRKRLHTVADDSSDSDTSVGEESFFGSSDDDEDYDHEILIPNWIFFIVVVTLLVIILWIIHKSATVQAFLNFLESYLNPGLSVDNSDNF